MKTILVPTDFSAASVNAAHYAADMAAALKMKVLLMHVVQLPLSAADVPLTPATWEEMMDDANTELQHLKDKLAHHHKGLPISAIGTAGRLADVLKSMVEQANIFAIIMGMQGAGALQQAVFGSNTLTAMRYLKCPVMVIPPGAHYRPLKKIALACDMHDVEQTVPVQQITALLSLLDCSLDILYIEKHNQDASASQFISARLLQSGLSAFHPNVHFLDNKDVAEGLDAFMHQHHTDLLVVLPKTHGLFALFHKSISKAVMARFNGPVMALHTA